MTPEQAQLIVKQALEVSQGGLLHNQINRENMVRAFDVNLGTEVKEIGATEIGFPFKSIWVEEASDSSAYVYLKLQNKETGATYLKLRQGDSLVLPFPVSTAFLHFPAQSGKTMRLMLSLYLEFKTGRQISVNSGGVSINEGSSFDAQTKVSITGGTPAVIAPANSDRKVCVIENATGQDLFIGNSSVNGTAGHANRGIKYASGAIFEWKNTAALYGVCAANGDIHYLDQE